MKDCLFCSIDLTGKRAREHVIARSWLKELKYHEWMLDGQTSTGGSVRQLRRHPAHSFMAGDVCGDCNSHWMRDLDQAVQECVLEMARGRLQPSDVPVEMRPLLGRWALKTACAMEGTDSKDRRHIPLEVRRSVLENRDPPGSYALQACLFPVQALGVATLDVWMDTPVYREVLAGKPQSDRLKFGISIGHAVFAGICLFDVEWALYGTHSAFHFPIHLHRARNADVDNDPLMICKMLGWDVDRTLPHAFSLLALDPLTVMPKTAPVESA
ncbi:hypothetical protein [Roseateles sp. L2-2]|uniref:hypothetical protein n=1 Tax=Roseateles TaxID=93681 RepID=UPI003D35F41A